MALTFRSEKGSALTNTELDNNFRHFTGSHEVSGTLTATDISISGSLSVTGSAVNMANLPTNETEAEVGGLWLSGSTGINSKYLVVRTA